MSDHKAVTDFNWALVVLGTAFVPQAVANLERAMAMPTFRAVLSDGLVPTVGEEAAGSLGPRIASTVADIDDDLRSLRALRRQLRTARDLCASIAPDLVTIELAWRHDPAEAVCKRCGDAFGASRRDARYCSPACRQGAYRNRQVGDTSAGGSPEP